MYTYRNDSMEFCESLVEEGVYHSLENELRKYRFWGILSEK